MMGIGGRVALLLVVLNAGVLVAGWLVQRHQATPQPLPGYNADKINLVQAPAIPSEGKRGGQEAPAIPLAEVPAKPAPAAVGDGACLFLRDYSQATHDRLRGQLATAGLTPAAAMPVLSKPLGWWVYIPPEADAVQRDANVERIKATGIGDLAVITRGSMINAISLGMFAEESQAIAHQARLRAKGLDAARYGPRPDAGTARVNLAALSEERRRALASAFKADLAPCP